MSKDSSKPAAAALKRPLHGARIAGLALGATVVLFFAAQIIGGLIVGIIPVVYHWFGGQGGSWLKDGSVAVQFAYGLLADGLIIGGVMLLLKWFRWRPETIGLKVPKAQHILFGVLAAVPYYVLFIAVVAIVGVLIPSLNISQKQELGFDSVHGQLSLILTFVGLVVVPPLAEEIAMRGFLYTGLRQWMPKIVAALIVSGLFGAAHLAEGGDAGPLWVGAIDTFMLSLVLVFLREKTGNLWAGITLHAIKNGVAFVSLYILALH